MTISIIAVVLVLLVLWMMNTKRSLAIMCENANNAMNALTALLDLTKGYAAQEAQTLLSSVKSRRSAITATSTPNDVLKQEEVISEALDRLSMAAEQCPELKTDEGYARCMNAVDSYEKMVRTSGLIYNASVTKLNRTIQMFPTSLIAGLMGVHQRDYLEVTENKKNMPNMKQGA